MPTVSALSGIAVNATAIERVFMDISKLKVGAIIRWSHPDYSSNSKTFMVADWDNPRKDGTVFVMDLEGKWNAVFLNEIDLVLE